MSEDTREDGVQTTTDESVQSFTGQVSTEETQEVGSVDAQANAGETELTETTEETTEENVEEEPETTLDEEVAEEETEVEVAGLPLGTVSPADAPEVEFLAVVNSTGFTKTVLPRAEAIEMATKGGFSVREATEEEIPKTE